MSETTLATPASSAPLPRMSFEEFLEFGDGHTWAEWVDGEVTLLSTSTEHQRLLRFLFLLLALFVEARDLGEIFPPPFLMRLSERPSGREPDILFVTRENQGRLQEKFLEGPADLVVEIISPDNLRRDRVDKFHEYEQAGVREYWIIDAVNKGQEFFQLNASGQYQSIAPDDQGRYHSAVLPGFWLDVTWLWQEPRLKVDDARRAWGWV